MRSNSVPPSENKLTDSNSTGEAGFNKCNTDEWLLTSGGVENVDISVDVGVTGAGDLNKGRGGEDQYVGAGGVLWGVQLRCLHVQRGAATKHWTCRHRVWQDRGVNIKTVKKKKKKFIRQQYGS